MGKRLRINAAVAAIIAIMAAACGANEGILRSGKPDTNAANVAPQRSSVDRVIADMQTAGFTTILVLRRKDGARMDAEDRSVIRAQTSDANRRIGSDDETAFIIGSNHPMTAEKMAVLNGRFAIEDRSPQDGDVSANTNK
jgi:hypothetical protein